MERKAAFAGGCFWCMQPAFDEAKGVIKTIVGYTGDSEQVATYKQVSTGLTNHVEAIQVQYTDETSYKTLVEIFLRHIDPTDDQGQFGDRGTQYQPVIFYDNKEEEEIAKEVIKNYQQYFEKPIVVKLREKQALYSAEDGHQNYYKKHPIQYKLYAHGSGRKSFLKEQWAKEKESSDNL